MTTMTLYSGPLSMYGAKAHIAALEKNLAITVVMVPFTPDHRYEPKHPQVLRVNPKGQVPVLVHGKVEIFDSTQIFEYLEDLQPLPPLWPAAAGARAEARLLELKSDEVFFPHVIRLMGLQSRLSEPPAQEAIAHLCRYYHEMDSLLVDRDFLVDQYTYADIAFFMAQLFAARLGAPMPAATPRLIAWRERLTKRSAVQQVVARFVQTLTLLGLAVPDFMSAAVATRGA